jgi:hypothetical protein
MLKYLLGRVTLGSHTQPFPAAAPLPERYRGRPALDRARCPDGCAGCAAAMPSGLLRPGAGGAPPALDLGAGLFSPEEAAACPHGALRLLALEKTLLAVPEPRLVIAVGACALSGGPFAGSPEAGTGVPPELRVDLCVPGCPPHPRTLLDGLLRLLGRIERGARA